MAFCTGLATFRFLKLLTLNKRVNALNLTLRYAFKELVSFGFVYLIICLGFIQSAYVLFNDVYFGLSTIAKSLETMFKMILGKFPTNELVKANVVFGPLLYISFSVVCILVMLNLFISIINDAYEYVKNDDALIPVDAVVFDHFRNRVKKWFGWSQSDNFESSFGADKYINGITYFPTSVDKLIDSFTRVIYIFLKFKFKVSIFILTLNL